jgi:2'-5' RNA ligase
MIRLFVSAGLSEELRSEIEARLKSLRPVFPGISWVRRETLHFTLAFLGSIDEARISEVIQTCCQAAGQHAAFPLSLGGFGAFPPRGRPRVFWLGTQEGGNELIALQALGLALEDRPFIPHLTLGRVKDPSARLPEKSIWSTSLKGMQVSHIEVMRSDLKASGAEYTVMGICPLNAQDVK